MFVTTEMRRNAWQNGTLKGHFFFILALSDKFTVKSAREMDLGSLQAVLSHQNPLLLFTI